MAKAELANKLFDSRWAKSIERLTGILTTMISDYQVEGDFVRFEKIDKLARDNPTGE